MALPLPSKYLTKAQQTLHDVRLTSSRQFGFLVRPNVHGTFHVCTKRMLQTAVVPVCVESKG